MVRHNTRFTADDFGQSLGINHAIILMAYLNQVNCISVLMTGKFLPNEQISTLKNLKENTELQIGLHLDIAQFPSLTGAFEKIRNRSFFSRALLLHRYHFYLRNRKLLIDEIVAQVDLFKVKFGFLPDYYDSHLHFHQFPGFAKVFIYTLKSAHFPNSIFIRNTSYPLFKILKKILRFPIRLSLKILALSLLGSSYRRILKAEHILTNKQFLGVNPFSESVSYNTIFEYYSDDQEQNQICVTHPSAGTDASDSICSFRLEEYNFFLSRTRPN